MAGPLRALGRRRADLHLFADNADPSADVTEAASRHNLARAALRLILASRLSAKTGAPMTAVDMLVRADGKPLLSGNELAFSLAHSGLLALVAVAETGPLGVDLELPRPVAFEEPRRLQIEAVATAFQSGVALPSDPERRLLAAWTRLEAVAKATGEGVGRMMTRLGMTRTTALARDPEPVRQAAHWIGGSGLVVRDLALGPGIIGALASPVNLPPPRLLTEPEALAELISAT